METRIINICRRLHKKNFLAGCDGNVSARTAEGLIKITPGGLSKRSLKKEQIALMDLEGQPLKGQPSSEKFMHLAVYQEQPRAGAAVHAHPPHAVALSLARPGWRELPAALPEIIIALGKVPFVPYVQPGTRQLGGALRPFVKKSQALVLSHHGALTWGESLEEAYMKMEWLEHSCQIICLAESMGAGGARPLPAKAVDSLKAAKKPE